MNSVGWPELQLKGFLTGSLKYDFANATWRGDDCGVEDGMCVEYTEAKKAHKDAWVEGDTSEDVDWDSEQR